MVSVAKLLIGAALIFGVTIGGIYLMSTLGVDFKEGNGRYIPFSFGLLCGAIGWPLSMMWAGVFKV